MQSRERERRLVVIENRSRPGDGGVACNAGGGKASADMVWIRRGIELRHVAGGAIRRSAGELSIDVALGASNGIMSTREREGRLTVIKHGSCPGNRRMARGAGGREACLDVAWIGCPVELGHMARSTVRRSAGELSINVALGARNRIVSTREREGRLAVIKNGACPRNGRMAEGAGGG